MQHDRTPAADCRGALRHPRRPAALDAVLAEPDVATGYPDAATWADFFIRSPVSDAEALTTFAARDRRFDDTADPAQPHDPQDRS